MRDIAEARHLNFINKNKYYYEDNIISEIKSNDYINFVKNYITNEKSSFFFKKPWTYINMSNNNWMANAWKIHISATSKNHIQVLNIVAKYAIEKQLNFKFSSNIQEFCYLNSKSIARASCGKFIVLYPLEQDFLKTLEDLYNLLQGFDGPYILSDRPYKDSKIVYYRYGEIDPIRILDGYGTITTKMVDNKNELISDNRVPYFDLPEFVKDNLYKPIDEGKSNLLKKYDIKEILHFSAQGGVYIATYNNHDYVIKEARKYAGLDVNFTYATDRLKKECTMMKLLASLDCVPMPIELIEEYGNAYLIEEYIVGEALNKFPFNNSPLIRIEAKGDSIKQKFDKNLMNIIHSSLHAISEIHNNGIILNDISPNNIIYNSESSSITFVDYEVAYHILDECNKTDLFTHGFTSEGIHSAVKHDLHKLGLVFMHCIMPFNKIFSLTSQKKAEALNLFEKLNVVPKNIIDTINGLINYQFNNADEAIRSLNDNALIIIQNKELQDIKNDIENIKLIKDSIISNINCSTGKYLVASDPTGFTTCEYSFGFGIFGVLYSLHKMNIGDQISEHKSEEIVKRFMTNFYRSPNSISSGLFVGLSGIVVALSELGFINESMIIMKRLIEQKIEMADLAYGLSGRMVALLKLYKTTSDNKYLNLAKKDADELKRTAIVREGLYYWKDECGDIYTGLTRGSSGIALTLLYLYLETDDKEYLDMGTNSLEADMAKLTENENGYICFNGWPEGDERNIYSPYIHNGIAGVGCVLLRYFLITRNEKYQLILNEIIEACDAKLSLFPGYLRGMSGIMTFLQDCVIYLNSDYANEILMRMSNNISFFQVSIDGIHGYAGDDLYRISHDLYTGSSGIILTLERNTCLSDKPQNPFLILDEYYDFNYSKMQI